MTPAAIEEFNRWLSGEKARVDAAYAELIAAVDAELAGLIGRRRGPVLPRMPGGGHRRRGASRR